MDAFVAAAVAVACGDADGKSDPGSVAAELGPSGVMATLAAEFFESR